MRLELFVWAARKTLLWWTETLLPQQLQLLQEAHSSSSTNQDRRSPDPPVSGRWEAWIQVDPSLLLLIPHLFGL